MVLHSNAPEHASFGMYNKCHFTLPVERDTAHLLQRPASLASSPGKAAPQVGVHGTLHGLYGLLLQLHRLMQHCWYSYAT